MTGPLDIVPGVLALTVPVVDFEIPIEVVVLGAITGLTYSVLAVGLVLAYRSSRVINFAHGEMGALAAGVVPVLVAVHGWSYWLTIPLALAIAAASGVVLELVVIRPLAEAPRLAALVATIGASTVLFAFGTFIPKGETLGSVVYPTPFDATVTIGSLHLASGQLLILAVVPLVFAGLGLFLWRTNVGMAARAAAENRDAARLVGVPVRRISLVVWVVVGLTAGVAAILLGPTQPIVVREALGPGILLRALAAAMLGGLVSLPWAFTGGIVVGVTELLFAWNYPTGGAVEVTLLVLIIGSFVLRRGLGQMRRGGERSSWSLAGALRELDPRVAGEPRVRSLRVAVVGAVVATAGLVPLALSSSQRVVMSGMIMFAIAALSLVVLTGYAGQISLGQFAFVTIGALVGGRMFQLGYPHWMGLLYALVAGGVVAFFLGLPALRIRGLFLAVVTLAFAVATDAWIFHQSWLVNIEGGTSSLEIPRPGFFDMQSELRFLWVALLALVLTGAAVHRLRRTGVGRAMMAVRDDEARAASLGISPSRAKLTAFVLAGMIAALAGYLYGALLVNFNDQAVFAPEFSLVLLGMVILGGVTTVTGAVAGAVMIRGLGTIVAPLLPQLLGSAVALIVGGAGLLVAVLRFPGGIAGELFRLRDLVVGRLTGASLDELDTSGRSEGLSRPRLEPREAAAGEASDDPVALAARDVTVRFGGNVAVDGVSVEARRQEILGVVGPNGAGKTTLFDVLSGFVAPDSGRVELGGRDVTLLPPHLRARLGLGRTFQEAELFREMRVDDVFKVAQERREASEVVPSVLGLPPSRDAERRKTVEAAELVEMLGLEPYAHLNVSELSTGMRRVVEMGTVIALGADVLLLDEPTAGVAQREVDAFRPVLEEVKDHLGATLVVIEHDLPTVMELADRVVVLSAGAVIAEGPPEVIREDPEVVAAYLGTEAPPPRGRKGTTPSVTKSLARKGKSGSEKGVPA